MKVSTLGFQQLKLKLPSFWLSGIDNIKSNQFRTENIFCKLYKVCHGSLSHFQSFLSDSFENWFEKQIGRLDLVKIVVFLKHYGGHFLNTFQNALQAALDDCRGVGETKYLQKKADTVVQYFIRLGFKIYRNASAPTHLERAWTY